MWGGWYPSAGLLAQIRREVGTSGDPAVRARETARERRTQGSPCEAEPVQSTRRRVDLEQVLTEHLLSAEEVARDRSLGVRDRAQAVKTVADMAKQLAAEQERKRAAENAPRVVLYFPAKDELARLEDI